jgi:hypothetical protein
MLISRNCSPDVEVQINTFKMDAKLSAKEKVIVSSVSEIVF